MMGKHSLGIQNRSADSVTGAGVVATDGEGKPSTNSGAQTQSPSDVKQPKMPTTVATFAGDEDTASNC